MEESQTVQMTIKARAEIVQIEGDLYQVRSKGDTFTATTRTELFATIERVFAMPKKPRAKKGEKPATDKKAK